MAFRNPTHTLPAYAIRGQIPGHQIDGPLNPGTVTPDAIAPNGVHLDHLENAIRDALAQKWWDFGATAEKWQKNSAATAPVSVSVPDASGGTAMRCQGYTVLIRPDVRIPYDSRALYRVSATVRQTVPGAVTANQRVYVGVAGYGADRETYVNITGANTLSSQAFAAARGVNLTAGAGWQTFTGYMQGYGASAGDAGPNPSLLSPMALHPSVRYITPILYLNYTGGTGTVEVDTVTIEAVPVGPVNGQLQIIPGTVVADALSADAIDGKIVNGLTMNAGQLNSVEINGVDITGTSSITGATIQTAATGRRIVMTPDGDLELYSGLATHDPGLLEAGLVQTNGTDGWLRLRAPSSSGNVAELYMEADAGGMKSWKLGPLDIVQDPPPTSVYPSTRAIVNGDAEVRGDLLVYDTVTAGNIKTLHVTITPTAANTPTPMTITGLGMPGVPRVSATATTTLPGTRVTGVGVSSISADSVTIWVTRTNTDATGVDVVLISG